MTDEKEKSPCCCVVICEVGGGKGLKVLTCESEEARELLAKIRATCDDSGCCD